MEDEIEVLPEFIDIFTNKCSFLGWKGRTILELRKKHKMKSKKYKPRKKHELSTNWSI